MRPLHGAEPRFHFATQMSAKRFLCFVVKKRKGTPWKHWRHTVIAFGIVVGPVNDPDQKMHTYEVRPREDHWGVDLISDVLPFGRLLYLEVREAVAYAKFYSSSQAAVIRIYDAAGNLTEMYVQAGEFKE